MKTCTCGALLCKDCVTDPRFKVGQKVVTCSENVVTIRALDEYASGGKARYLVEFPNGQQSVLAEAYLERPAQESA